MKFRTAAVSILMAAAMVSASCPTSAGGETVIPAAAVAAAQCPFREEWPKDGMVTTQIPASAAVPSAPTAIPPETLETPEPSPTPARIPLGGFTVTYYGPEAWANGGYTGTGAWDNALEVGVSCALPHALAEQYHGQWIYIDGVGMRRVDDKGPGGIVDVYVESEAVADRMGKMRAVAVFVVTDAEAV